MRQKGGSKRSNGKYSGPRLPNQLTKELEGRDANEDYKRGEVKLSRKDRRKMERQSKKHRPNSQTKSNWQETDPSPSIKPTATAADREQQKQKPAHPPSTKRRREDDEEKHQPKKNTKKKSNTKFEELLQPSLNATGKAGIDAEREYQRQLAKKLGLKDPDASLGDGDGIDDLLNILDNPEGGSHSDEEDFDDEQDDDELERFRNRHKGAEKPAAVLSKKYSATMSTDSDSDDEEQDLAAFDSEDSEDEEEDGFGSESDLDMGEEDDGEDEGELDLLNSGSELEIDDMEQQQTDDDDQNESESNEEEDIKPLPSLNKSEDLKKQTPDATGRYIPPAARAAAANNKTGTLSKFDQEALMVQKKVRGLLNRLAEANIQGIVTELATIHKEVGRRQLSDAVCSELVSATAEGPRASDRFAAVASACIAGLAGTIHSSEIIANFLARVSDALERGYSTKDSLTNHNLAMVLAHLYIAGAVKHDLLFSLLEYWKDRFEEGDVAAIATLLRAAGLKLRAADPEQMKEFVVAVHEKAAELRSLGKLTPRAQAMLDLVVDVKNNRTRDVKKGGGAVVPSLVPAVTKWMKGTGVEDLAVGGIRWQKVMDPSARKGEWWLPTAADAAIAIQAAQQSLKTTTNNSLLATDTAAKDASQEAVLLKLAAQMRMNTDTKRSIFLIVMGSDDCMDAFERLLRLNLKGTHERDIVKIIVQCCLQEPVFNPYYALLLKKLCDSGKGHKMTLQYCLWDHFKEVSSMDVRNMTVLAKLTGAVLASFAVPSTMLKTIDFSEKMAAKQTLFWRLVFENVLAGCKSNDDLASLFSRISAQEQLVSLKAGLLSFLKTSVGPWLASKDAKSTPGGEERLALLLKRCRAAEKALGGKR